MKTPPVSIRPAFALRRAITALAFLSAAASLPLILAAASADEPAQPMVAGAPKARTLQNVISFGKKDGHPEWFVLRPESGKSTTLDGKEVDQPKTPIDTTPMKFGHAKHMSSGAVRNLLKEIKEGRSQSPVPTGRAVHIEFGKDEEGKETLAMSCTFCHENDSAGRYMKPIKFETHCADCHSTNLGVVSVAVDKDADDKPVSALKLEKKMWNPDLRKSVVVPDQIPHGSSQYVADMIEKQIGQWALASPPVVDKAKYDEWMKQREGAAAPEKPSGGRGRGRSSEAKPEEKPAEKAEEKPADEPPPSSRRRSSSDSATPAAPPAPKAVVIPEVFADAAMLNEWKAKLRDAALNTLRSGDHCGYCHTNIKDGKDTKSFFEVSDQKIPEVWLPKSFFSHVSHATMSCESCHALAKFPKPKDASDEKAKLMFDWANETARIMLPSIESCRECHAHTTPTGSTGAPSECVVCHTYHAKLPSSVQGKQTIKDVIQGGARAGAPEAAPAKPAGKAEDKPKSK